MKKKRKTKKLNNKNKKKPIKKTYKKNKANTLFQIKGGDCVTFDVSVPQYIIYKRKKLEEFIMNQSKPKMDPIDILTPTVTKKDKFKDYFTQGFKKFISDYMCDTTYENFFTRSISSMNKKKIIFEKCFNETKFRSDAHKKFTLTFSKDEIKHVFKDFF